VKTVVFMIAKYTGLFWVCRLLTQNKIRILAYHGIWLGPAHYGNHLYMSPAKFADRMKYLASSDYPLVTLDDVYSSKDGSALPSCPVVVTIDDGWYGTYKHMLPSLEINDIPATIYLTTYYAQKQTPVFQVAMNYMLFISSNSLIDVTGLNVPGISGSVNIADEAERKGFADLLLTYASDRCTDEERQVLAVALGKLLEVDYQQLADDKVFHLMSLDQARDALDRGFDIQPHTHRHRVYRDGQSVIVSELNDCNSVLAGITSRKPAHFCYPSGEYDENLWSELESLGMDSATTADSGLADRDSRRFALPRVFDGENVSNIEFEAELSGFCEFIRSVKSILRRH
jgi:peptidoglycan/xylan/chitin deacetylase (PgdA/CDA1 family)